MAYPKESSFTDLRSKIKHPSVSKTKSILLELEKLKADSNVVPRRRTSLFANRSMITSSPRSRDSPSCYPYSSPSTSFTPRYRRQTIQPMWPRVKGIFHPSPTNSEETNPFDEALGASPKSTSSFNMSVTDPISFDQDHDLVNNSNAGFSFLEPKVNETTKGLENVCPFTFDKPIIPTLPDLQNTFDFELPENRGPKLDSVKLTTNDKDSELILNELNSTDPAANK